MSPKPVALVTGVTGYIGQWVAKWFLDNGYAVRGTSRSKASAQPLIDVLGDQAADFEIYEVADITVPGAFDEAVKGVTVVAHLATPVALHFDDPDPVIHVAVEGALSILRSAKAHGGETLKTFIQMSSIAAIRNNEPAPYLYTEADWNDSSVKAVRELGAKAGGFPIYSASKTLSERAVWEFRDQEKVPFNIVAVNPGWVSGPPVVSPKNSSQIGNTTATIFAILSGQEVWGQLGPTPTYIDVRDVARLIVWTADNGDKANGERYLAVAGQGSEQAITDILREAYPERRDIVKAGNPGEGYRKDFSFDANVYPVRTTKAVEATGQDWIQYDKVVLDTAKAYEHLL